MPSMAAMALVRGLLHRNTGIRALFARAIPSQMENTALPESALPESALTRVSPSRVRFFVESYILFSSYKYAFPILLGFHVNNIAIENTAP